MVEDLKIAFRYAFSCGVLGAISVFFEHGSDYQNALLLMALILWGISVGFFIKSLIRFIKKNN